MTTATLGTQHASDGFSRAVVVSLAVHLSVAAAVVFAPREWFAKPPKPPVMTISLGGTVGPKTSGTTAIGGRTVEAVAPPPKRPEPIKPAPKKEPVALVPAKPTAAPKPDRSVPVEMRSAARPPVTGPQVVQGNTAVETGARGQSAGLTFGGGGTGGEEDLKNFCCPDYLMQLAAEISSHWDKAQQEKGVTVLKFAIVRNGSIVDIETEKPSGSGVLDRASKRALIESKLPPLPGEYTSDRLTVHLNFPYGTQ